MITLSVNCEFFHAKLTEHGCHMNQTIREECLRCERRDRRIQYVGLLKEFMKKTVTRDGQEEWQRAHIPCIGGSNPPPAPKRRVSDGKAAEGSDDCYLRWLRH